MTKVFCLATILALGIAAHAAGSPAGSRCSSAPAAYPTFCAIPATPTDVRDAAAFRAQVRATRLAGARVVRDSATVFAPSAPEPADAFALSAQAQAAYPAAPASKPTSAADTFAEDARHLVTPPARRKR